MSTPAPVADRVTRDGLLQGARLTVPLWPGISVFAMAYGTAAVQKGLSVLEAVLASGMVFAGAAQLVALELWTDRWTLAGILLVSVVTFTVNARIILQGASLQPWLVQIPGRITWPSLALLTDANWVISERYRAEGGKDAGVMIGAGLMLWIVWTITTLPGALLGKLVQDPSRFAIDLVLPVFFSAMAVPLWKGRRDTIAWTVAGAVSLATWWLVPGYFFMVTGALAGAVTGALLGRLDRG
ncbi:AzlC family ABC transporter permease [Alsobacter sp. R-9]